ncbi:MAG: substrate-binding domain-containing protein [Verrucomicrobiae bacterium]|nr:substrate-binding domain-containing protein [Verrucomicrobiae bacterium]
MSIGRFRQGDVPPLLIRHLEQAAMGGLVACHDAGLKVPQRDQVGGLGGFPAPSGTPSIGTICEPNAGVGKQALELLDKLIRKAKGFTMQTIFNAHLTTASTTAQRRRQIGKSDNR